MEEKRKFKRFAFGTYMDLRTGDGRVLPVSIENLSLKGASIRVDCCEGFSVGDECAFILNLADEPGMSVEGNLKVIWKKDKNKYGLVFVNVEAEYFMKLKRLLELTYDEDAQK